MNAEAKEVSTQHTPDLLKEFADSNNYLVRTARKEHHCDARNARGWATGLCPNVIHEGERYVEGEMDPYRAGGFGRERYCYECAFLMHRAALAKVSP